MTTVMFQYGGAKGKKQKLRISNDYLVIRTRDRDSVSRAAVSAPAREVLRNFQLVYRFVESGVELFHCRSGKRQRSLRDQARSLLKQEDSVRFAGRVLCHPKSGEPAVYTENLFLKLHDGTKRAFCRKLIKQYGLTIKREVEYAQNAYFLSAPEGSGMQVFDLAATLLGEESVEFCHPELVRRASRRAAFPKQWHLQKSTVNENVIDQHANVVAAWPLSEGEDTTIAIIDDGVDVDHEEFAGSWKVVAPRDVTRGVDDGRPGSGDNHGTSCAGVACAKGMHGASGVAPKSKLMPIRLASGLGSQAEADAFYWAATHGSDVISCSWGPWDGDFENPADPLHDHVEPLPDSTRLAIDFAIEQGRNGKGCVITWAAGNGNESVGNDGYASYEKVIAVAACDDRGAKAPYSDFGDAVWCAFPSNHFYSSLSNGIWTTDRSGAEGYNWGHSGLGDSAGHYTDSFGGTSSACPGAAGVAALVIARNPDLRWDQVKQILKECCDKIDANNGNYDADGHSIWYGYGRLNAQKAVELARPAQPKYTAIHTAIQDVAIRDLKKSRLQLAIGDTRPLKDLKVHVDIEHTWIGDLKVMLRPPAGIGVSAVTLHSHSGGGTQNLKRVYDTASTPAIAGFAGKNPQGKWTLEVSDTAQRDEGKIVSFSLELVF